MTELILDAPTSRLRIRTHAVGVLARLAHNLEIVASELRGRAHLQGDSWTAELQIPVAGLRVAGTLRDDRLDTSALSAADRREIERRMHQEVLVGTTIVQVRASGAMRDRADVRVELASGSASLTARLSPRERSDGAVEVSGRCQLSLAALRIREVRGPLGAFKIRDELDIEFELTLRPVG